MTGRSVVVGLVCGLMGIEPTTKGVWQDLIARPIDHGLPAFVVTCRVVPTVDHRQPAFMSIRS
jgi:hypothetical protein